MPVKSRIFQLLASLLLITFPAFSQVIADEDFIPGEALVQFKKPVDEKFFSSQINTRSTLNLVPVRLVSKTFNIWLVKFDPTISKTTLLDVLYSFPEVAKAQYNHKTSERLVTPNDQYFNNQWDYENTGQSSGIPGVDISATEAWNITTGGLTAHGDTIVVAVVDGGFALTHPDLDFYKNYHDIPGNGVDDDGNGYIDDYKGWNAYNHTGNVTNNNHGTHVSGTVGARGNNGIGVTGVNWNVKILAVQGSTSSEATAVEAYTYVYDMRKMYDTTNGQKGAYVVSTNSSFGVDYGNPVNYPIWCAMYDSLGSLGILSATATANRRLNIDVANDIPTACPSDYMISVTNTTNQDSLYSSAGYGLTTIDLGAPGTNIFSTTMPASTPSYGNMTGTSMATPHVAGAVALMFSAATSAFMDAYDNTPASYALKVKELMLDNVDTIAALRNKTVSNGRLNLFKSVNAIQSLPVNVKEPFVFENVRIYPNPVEENLFIENAIGREFIIYDMIGKAQVNKVISSDYESINLNNLPGGVYFLVMRGAGESMVMRVVVI